MAYVHDMWVFADSIEHEYKYKGRYGAKGEKRAERRKATPKQIKLQNQRNKEKKVRRLIKANFTRGDYWITLKYPKGTRKPISEVMHDVKLFLRRMRRAYGKCGAQFKYIYRIEIGSQGGIHIHMIINRIIRSDIIAAAAWEDFGIINYTPLYDAGGYQNLACYLVKPQDEDVYEQLSFIDADERKKFMKYSSSRNLIRPVPEHKEYKRRTVERMITNGIQAADGYYIDKSSIVSGINPYTGMSYLYYTEIAVKKKREVIGRYETVDKRYVG